MSVPIAALVQTDILTLTPDMPIRHAVALLVENRQAAAPVLDESGALRGILTQKDCFRPALQASYYQEWQGRVADHMTTEVATLPADTDLVSAAEAFLAHRHRVFPVVDRKEVKGLLRRSDVLEALIRMG